MRGLIFAAVFWIFFVPNFIWAQGQKIANVSIFIDATEDPTKIAENLYDAIFTAKKVFQKEFGIAIKVVEFNYYDWSSSSNNFDAEFELVRLMQASHNENNDRFVVGFTSRSFFRMVEKEGKNGSKKEVSEVLNGVAVWGKRFAIVQLQKKTPLILIHELGHLFGADDTSDTNSVMNGKDVDVINFDEKSKEAILANCDKIF